ncbi:MAG: hypothetical protein WEB58_15295, partial [Planctomycetaceae bacterium]
MGTWSLALLIIAGQLRVQIDEAPQPVADAASSQTISSAVEPMTFEPDIAYAVPVSADESAVFDLSFDEGSRYGLIVSSLGDGERRYRVMLTSPSTDVATTGTPHFVLPLQR